MDLTNFFLSLPSPFPRSIQLSLPSTFPLSSLPSLLPSPFSTCLLRTTTLPIYLYPTSTTLSSLGKDFTIHVIPGLKGGKGGFGSQLRAAGGRMSSRKKKNKDGEEDLRSCRDLMGRRLGSVKEAQKLADYVASLPEITAKVAQQQKEKLEAIKEDVRKMEERIANGEGSSKKRAAEGREEERERVENVRGAVASAMKLNKKRKLNPKVPIPNEKESIPEESASSSSEAKLDSAAPELEENMDKAVGLTEAKLVPAAA